MDLENIISNINLDGVHFVNLQYGDITKDIRGLSPQSINKLSLFEDIDKKNDLEGLAALVMCCDLIVSIPNITVHLAGGLGKRCEVLLKPYHGWEWHHNAKSSYWYGSCKLHRIGEDGSLESFGDLLSDFREVI
jgi:ADP-heptose:LPS heptosyltransferase